jgi:hypothetical protein
MAHLHIWLSPHQDPHFKRMKVPGMLHLDIHVNLTGREWYQNTYKTTLAKTIL